MIQFALTVVVSGFLAAAAVGWLWFMGRIVREAVMADLELRRNRRA